jgi:hypothetical protein
MTTRGQAYWLRNFKQLRIKNGISKQGDFDW